jgi:hypothetical protein
LTDGGSRGGRIIDVQTESLSLLTGADTIVVARSEIASVKVKRGRGTVWGGLVGSEISGAAVTASACADEDIDCDGNVVLWFAIGSVPGLLLGALIGSQVGGDVEIVP